MEERSKEPPQDPKLSTANFLKRETTTELDAIHPRFLPREDSRETFEYEAQNHYFCEFCKQFFSPSYDALAVHFGKQIVEHPVYATCLYCHGSVYEYKFNNRQQIYHNCKDSLKFNNNNP